MIVTIKQVEDRTKGDKTWKVLTDENGKERHVFDHLKAKWGLLQLGHNVELIYEKKSGEQYPALVDVKEATVAEAVQKESKSDFQIHALREKATNKRTALMQAMVFYSGVRQAVPSLSQVLKAAQDCFAWLEDGIIPPQEETPEKKDLVKPVVAKTPGIISAKEPDATIPTLPMKTYDDVFAAASSLYSLSQADVLEILGATQDKGYLIDDKKKVINPGAAWLKIKR